MSPIAPLDAEDAPALALMRGIVAAPGFPQADALRATLGPHRNRPTTTQAAEYLNVSRPYLVRLLREGKLPFHRIGTHRRLRLSDLRTYKERQEEESYAALAELQTQAQDLNMGYEQDLNMGYEQDLNMGYEQDLNMGYEQDLNMGYEAV